MKNIENRRSEAVVAFDAAQVWVESAMNNVNTSLEALGTKMNNEILLVQNNLEKQTEAAISSLRERSNQQISQIEEIGKSFINQVESQIETGINDFSVAREIALNSSIDSLVEFPEKVTDETASASKKAIVSSKEKFEVLQSEVSQKTIEFEEAAKVSHNEFESFIDNISDHISKVHTTTLEEIQQAAVLSNQHAASKFESVGVDLKASLSSMKYEMVENLVGEVNERITSIEETKQASSADVDDAVSKAKAARTKAITDADKTIQDSTNNWGTTAKNTINNVSKSTNDSLEDITGKTKDVIDTLKAIHSASEEVVNIPTKNTWYISGNEEICAHLLDMSERAKESIIISVLSLGCLDLKKLSKIRDPSRRVLIVPHSEEQEALLDSLKGWRIWETDSPITMAVRDNAEIMVGGQTESEIPLCIVSVDPSYLKLYHDSLGPILVRESMK